MNTYVYIKDGRDQLYTVGFFKPARHLGDGPVWIAESDYDDWRDAAARVNYLNGGTGALPAAPYEDEVTNLQDDINRMLFKAGIAEHWREQIMKLIAEAEKWRQNQEDAKVIDTLAEAERYRRMSEV